MNKKLISLIVPAYNEEECIGELASQLTKVFAENSTYDFEALIIENGSLDGTWELLQEINRNDPRFKVIRLAHLHLCWA